MRICKNKGPTCKAHLYSFNELTPDLRVSMIHTTTLSMRKHHKRWYGPINTSMCLAAGAKWEQLKMSKDWKFWQMVLLNQKRYFSLYVSTIQSSMITVWLPRINLNLEVNRALVICSGGVWICLHRCLKKCTNLALQCKLNPFYDFLFIINYTVRLA